MNISRLFYQVTIMYPPKNKYSGQIDSNIEITLFIESSKLWLEKFSKIYYFNKKDLVWSIGDSIHHLNDVRLVVSTHAITPENSEKHLVPSFCNEFSIVDQ